MWIVPISARFSLPVLSPTALRALTLMDPSVLPATPISLSPVTPRPALLLLPVPMACLSTGRPAHVPLEPIVLELLALLARVTVLLAHQPVPVPLALLLTTSIRDPVRRVELSARLVHRTLPVLPA